MDVSPGSQDSTNRPSRLIKILSNPVVGFVGTVGSLVGLILSIVFYLWAVRERELVWSVHPVPSSLVRAGETSRLTVAYDGVPVTTDITAVQIAFWNRGDESIRDSHVLEPLRFSTKNGEPVLEARLRRTSRTVADIKLDRRLAKDGTVQVDWRILERGDGGVLELIIAGATDAEIDASAVVEGQPILQRLKSNVRIRTPVDQYRTDVRSRPWFSSFVFLSLIGFGIWAGITLIRQRKEVQIKPKAFIVLAVWVMLVIFAFNDMVGSFSIEPPFGF